MTNTTTRPNQTALDDYVEKCKPFLTDLEAHQQAQLLTDIREIVAEVAYELDGEPEDLVGTPIRFVSDLRAAAGLPPLLLQARPDPSAHQREAPLTELLAQLVRKAVTSARQDAVPFTRALLRDLRPAWWVARGLGLAFFFGRVTEDLDRPQGLMPDLFGSSIAGVLAAVVCVVLSVRAGRSSAQRSPLRRMGWVVLGGVSVVSLLFVSEELRYPNSYPSHETFVQVAEPAPVPVGFEGFDRPEPVSPVPVFIVTGDYPDVWQVSGPDSAHQLLETLHESGYDISSLTIEDQFGHQLLAGASIDEAHDFVEWLESD